MKTLGEHFKAKRASRPPAQEVEYIDNKTFQARIKEGQKRVRKLSPDVKDVGIF